jgi:hypothetical protein
MRSIEKAAGMAMCGEQRFDFTPQIRIAAAGGREERGALTRRTFERGLHQVADSPPAPAAQRVSSR